MPKYEKHLTYSVLSEDSKNKTFTVYSIKSNKVIIQVPIKNDYNAFKNTTSAQLVISTFINSHLKLFS